MDPKAPIHPEGLLPRLAELQKAVKTANIAEWLQNLQDCMLDDGYFTAVEQMAEASKLAPAVASELTKAQAATAKYAKASAAERPASGYQALQMRAPPGRALVSSRSGVGV